MSNPLKLFSQPEIKHSSLIVCWTGEASTLSTGVTDYLKKKLNGRCFGEIEPMTFFPLRGVAIENDLVIFPESKFYAFPENNLVLLQSTAPSHEWYQFMTLVLDFTEQYCHLKELYTIGGMVSLGAHTAPRELMATFNSPELKKELDHYNLAGGFNYQTPNGQRPTLNSYFLWLAGKRNIPGTNLMVLIPFYLVSSDDPGSQKRVLQFFNQRLDLGIDFSELNERIKSQNEKIARLRDTSTEINELINKLEQNLRLSAEEHQQLLQEIDKYLREHKG